MELTDQIDKTIPELKASTLPEHAARRLHKTSKKRGGKVHMLAGTGGVLGSVVIGATTRARGIRVHDATLTGAKASWDKKPPKAKKARKAKKHTKKAARKVAKTQKTVAAAKAVVTKGKKHRVRVAAGKKGAKTRAKGKK